MKWILLCHFKKKADPQNSAITVCCLPFRPGDVIQAYAVIKTRFNTAITGRVRQANFVHTCCGIAQILMLN